MFYNVNQAVPDVYYLQHQPQIVSKQASGYYKGFPQSKVGKRSKAKQWSPQEDSKLIKAIDKYGTDNWGVIAKEVGNGRTRGQCSQRWSRCLNPDILHGKWTPEEEKTLLELVRIHGTKAWKKITEILTKRSDAQCRFHYRLILKRNGQRLSSDSAEPQEVEIPKDEQKTNQDQIKQESIVPKFKSQLPPIQEMINCL